MAMPLPVPVVPEWDDTVRKDWPPGFIPLTIPSSADGLPQAAIVRRAEGKARRPLLVSLHTWSCHASHRDELAARVAEADWNYVRPDFRGPNWTPDACLSDKAISDIDDAIAWGLALENTDPSAVFVAGTSGGGHATLGMYLRSRHRVRAFSAWAPISDLGCWYGESRARKNPYADHILAATRSGKNLDVAEARRRSPLHWDDPPKAERVLDIATGVHDGFTGSVPIQHSLLFYNKVALALGCTDPSRLVSDADLLDLLVHRRPRAPRDLGEMGGRRIHYRNSWQNVSVTVFEGGHEMITAAAMSRMQELAGGGGSVREGGSSR